MVWKYLYNECTNRAHGLERDPAVMFVELRKNQLSKAPRPAKLGSTDACTSESLPSVTSRRVLNKPKRLALLLQSNPVRIHVSIGWGRPPSPKRCALSTRSSSQPMAKRTYTNNWGDLMWQVWLISKALTVSTVDFSRCPGFLIRDRIQRKDCPRSIRCLEGKMPSRWENQSRCNNVRAPAGDRLSPSLCRRKRFGMKCLSTPSQHAIQSLSART